MNKQRRKVLHSVLDKLANLKGASSNSEALELLHLSIDEIQQCIDEEQDALDNRPESLMWSAINEDMTDNISDLSNAEADLEVVEEYVEKAVTFNYDLVKENVTSIVNLIKQAIHR